MPYFAGDGPAAAAFAATPTFSVPRVTPMSTPRSKIIPASAAEACPTLDPCTLGRPFHLLDGFAEQLQTALREHIEAALNRRYRAAYQLDRIEIGSPQRLQPQGKWRCFASPAGQLGFALDRALLLSILDHRYGSRQPASQPAPPRLDLPETETEQRLAQLLGRQLMAVLAHCMAGEAAAGQPLPVVEALPGLRAEHGVRTIAVSLTDRRSGLAGRLYFSLDGAGLDALLQRLAGQRVRPRLEAEGPRNVADKLRFRLVAKLWQKQMALGDLLDLQVGQILPLRLPHSADVYIGPSVLFRAAVAEHNNKLWLTSFEDSK